MNRRPLAPLAAAAAVSLIVWLPRREVPPDFHVLTWLCTVAYPAAIFFGASTFAALVLSFRTARGPASLLSITLAVAAIIAIAVYLLPDGDALRQDLCWYAMLTSGIGYGLILVVKSQRRRAV